MESRDRHRSAAILDGNNSRPIAPPIGYPKSNRRSGSATIRPVRQTQQQSPDRSADRISRVEPAERFGGNPTRPSLVTLLSLHFQRADDQIACPEERLVAGQAFAILI